MIDPLPPPVTLVSSELVESKDIAVMTFVIRGTKIRCLFGFTQIEWLHQESGKVLEQMKQAAKISAAP